MINYNYKALKAMFSITHTLLKPWGYVEAQAG